MESTTPLWILIAIAGVTTAVELIKRLVPRKLPTWLVRALAFVVAAGTAVVPILPEGSSWARLLLAIGTGAGAILAWHGLAAVGVVEGQDARVGDDQSLPPPVILALIALIGLGGCGAAPVVLDTPTLGGSFDVKAPPDGPIAVEAEGHFSWGPIRAYVGTDGAGLCLTVPVDVCFKWPGTATTVKRWWRPGQPDPYRAPDNLQRGMATYPL